MQPFFFFPLCISLCLSFHPYASRCFSFFLFNVHSFSLPPSLTPKYIKGYVRWGRWALPSLESVPGIPAANRNSANVDKTVILRPQIHERKRDADTQEDRCRAFQDSILTAKGQSRERSHFPDASQLLQQVQSACSCFSCHTGFFFLHKDSHVYKKSGPMLCTFAVETQWRGNL